VLIARLQGLSSIRGFWRGDKFGSYGVSRFGADPAADNRLFVEAVLYRYRTGMPWRDLPERFGDWNNVHQRFSPMGQIGCLGEGLPASFR
jgi:hypothetical protein